MKKHYRTAGLDQLNPPIVKRNMFKKRRPPRDDNPLYRARATIRRALTRCKHTTPSLATITLKEITA